VACVRNQFANVTAATNQPAGDAPLEGSQIQGRTSYSDEANRAHLLDRLHYHDGRGGVEKDFQALKGIGHKGLTIWDLLP
jgi:hypothetical protein